MGRSTFVPIRAEFRCPCNASADTLWASAPDQDEKQEGLTNNLVARFEDAGMLTEITGGRRRRVFRYDGYLALLSDEPTASEASE